MHAPVASTGLASLGRVDLAAFLTERTVGTVAAVGGRLIDAGMERQFGAQYTWSISADGDSVKLTPVGGRGRNNLSVSLPRTIDLSPDLIACFGAYDGDGNKTNFIGFAQNEPNLQEFVFSQLTKIFGSNFPIEVNLLEDTKYFEGPLVQGLVNQLRQQRIAQGADPAHIIERDLQNEVLWLRYQQSMPAGMPLPAKVRYTVSPKKGARASGQSSFEIIRNFAASAAYLPLLLAMVKGVIRSIVENQSDSGGQSPWLVWGGPPRTFARQRIDTLAFANSARCRYATTRGVAQYQAVAGGGVVTLRKQGGTDVLVHESVPITPLLALFFGLYLAEGTTAKAKFFTFAHQPEDLAIGFNSSEEMSLEIFLSGLTLVFPDVERIIEGWLVKIGTKYFAESTALAEKLGVPVTRGGPKGQGLARSAEMTAAVRLWALGQFPIMHAWNHKYSHIEFTGSGIPRVDVRCKSSAAPFLFSLVRDVVFEPTALRGALR